jgi:uncharacterized membrane protein
LALDRSDIILFIVLFYLKFISKTDLIVAWDIRVIIFLILAVLMMNRANHQVMRHRATIDNESRWRILLGVTIGSGVSLLTIVYMLKDAKHLAPELLTLHVGLV